VGKHFGAAAGREGTFPALARELLPFERVVYATTKARGRIRSRVHFPISQRLPRLHIPTPMQHTLECIRPLAPTRLGYRNVRTASGTDAWCRYLDGSTRPRVFAAMVRRPLSPRRSSRTFAACTARLDADCDKGCGCWSFLRDGAGTSLSIREPGTAHAGTALFGDDPQAGSGGIFGSTVQRSGKCLGGPL
jgi:hypothetical protein